MDEDSHHAAGLHRRDEGGQDHKAGHDQSNHVGEERIGLKSKFLFIGSFWERF